MRRLNARLLLILIIAIAVGGLAIQGLHAFQLQRQTGAFLREAARAEEAGNVPEAAGFLRAYLVLVPEDTPTMARLATLLFEQRDYQQSQALFAQVLLRDQHNDDARRRLVEASIRLERYQDAQYHLGFLLKSHPDDDQLWLQSGASLQGLGQFPQAVDAFRKAIDNSPTSISGYEQAAQLLADRLGRAGEAVVLLEKMLQTKANQQNCDAYLVRARFVQARADNSAVKNAIVSIRASSAAHDPVQSQKVVQQVLDDDLKEALRLAPMDPRVLLLAAQAALANGSVQSASELADRAVSRDPSNPDCYLVLAAIKLRGNQVSQAADCLSRGLQATDNAPALLWPLANLRIEMNDISEAKTLIERLRAIEAARPIARYLAARIQILESKWAEAAGELESVKGELKRWPQLYRESQLWLARCDARLGREDWAATSYHAALENDPDNVPARIGLVESLRSLGRIDEAIVELRPLAVRPDAPPAALETLLQLSIQKVLATPPSGRNWSAVDALLEQTRNKPVTVDRALLEAEVQLGKGHADDAGRTLRAAIEKEPKSDRLWAALAALSVREAHWDETERLLSEMQNRLSDSVTPRLAKAGYLIQRYGSSGKQQLRSIAQIPSEWSPSDRLTLASSMGRMAFAIGDYDEAQRLWQLVAAANPTDLQIRLMLVDLAWQTGKIDEMAKPLAEIAGIEHNGPLSQYGKALQATGLARRLKAESERTKNRTGPSQSEVLLQQALRQLDEARAKFPSWSKLPLLAAEICELRGNSAAALENYRAAFDLGERSSAVVERLLSLLIDRQENEKVETMVRELMGEKVPFSIEVTSLVSQALVQMGDRQGALELARKSAAASKDYRSNVLLGQLLRISGRTEEAEAELRKATIAAPKEASAWIALITFYSASGKRELSTKTVQAALSALEPERVWEVQGFVAQSTGNLLEAEKTYDAALRTMPHRFEIRKLTVETKLRNRRVAEAQTLLQTFLTSADSKSDPANAAWARRTLALSLAAAGSYPKHLEALELIDQNLRETTASDADHRVQGMIHASYPTFESRQKALQTLAELAPKPNALSVDDQIVLARLYLSRGEWIKASQIFSATVAKTKDPRHIAAYVDALLGQRELAAADDWLRRLEDLSPREFPTIDLRARLLAEQGRYSDAFDRVVAALRSEPSNGAPNRALRRAGSSRLEELGNELIRFKRNEEARRFLAQAEQLLTDSKGSPEDSVDRLQFLVRRGRAIDALNEFDRLGPIATADMDQACIACAALQTSDPQLLQRIDQSIARIAQSRPTSSVWMARAAVQDQLGQYDDEEASYRQALKLDNGTRVDALNNLAYLLALRKKDLVEARSLVDQAVARAGPMTALLDSRAIVALAAGQADAALADLEIAVSDGAAPVHLFHQARALMLNGEVAAAQTAFKKALDRGLTPQSLSALEASTFREFAAQFQTNDPTAPSAAFGLSRP